MIILSFDFQSFGQCTNGTNLLTNGDFENFTCTLPANGELNGAINQGCEPSWSASWGTPSICGDNHPQLPPLTSGSEYACIGSGIFVNYATTPPTIYCINTESFFQNFNFCVGATYTLRFDYATIYPNASASGIFDIFLANNVGVVAPNHNGQPCQTYPTAWQNVSNIVIPNNYQNAQVWQNSGAITFTVNNPFTQLLFALRPTGESLFDIGLDNVSLTCASPILPSFSMKTSGNNAFTFTANPTIPNGYSIQNFCWNFGDGTTANGQIVDHTFSSTAQNQVCLTITDNCGCTRSICQIISSEICGCGSNPTVLPQGTTSWANQSNIFVENDVIIPAGSRLDINASLVKINAGCKFVVMRGGAMQVRNASTLTNHCAGTQWEGILVWGNRDILHSAVENNNNPDPTGINPGRFNASGNGNAFNTIENMRGGIQAQRWWADPNDALYASINNDPNPIIPNYWGGLVVARAINFNNNRLSASFHQYPHPNYSTFRFCNFNGSTAMANTSEGVNIWATDNISFSNCTFDNVRSRGITALDASIVVRRSNFLNNRQGIALGSITDPGSITSIGTNVIGDANHFNDNSFGIWSDGVGDLDVQHNYFQHNTLAGVRINGVSGTNLVRNNSFENNRRGIELTNTLNRTQDVFCNHHVQDGIGIRIFGDCRGMRFHSNEFENQAADLVLSQVSGVTGRIAKDQGNQDAAIFNRFSSNESINDIRTTANTELFHYWPPVKATPAFIPDCDDDDGCAIPNNFHVEKLTNGFQDDCSTVELAPTCTTESCLDSLKTRFIWLSNQITIGQNTFLSELESTARAYNSLKSTLVWKWYQEGAIPKIENKLSTTDFFDAKLFLSVRVKSRNFAAAQTIINQLPVATSEQESYRNIQQIHLDFLQNQSNYQLSATNLQFLTNVAEGFLPVSSNARSLLYLLTGNWITPETTALDNFEEITDRSNPFILSNVRIYPNPANNQIQVSSSKALKTVQVYNPTGVLLYNLDATGKFEMSILLDKMANGLYFVRIVENESTTSKTLPFVVQH